MAVSFTPTYFNKRQYLYDTALSSDKFNSNKFNELDAIDSQQADMFAELSIGAKNKTSDTFNQIDFDRLNAEDSMLYLYNEFYVDKAETATDEETGETYNIYERNNEYLQYKIQEAIDQEIFNSLNGWEKFWATVGTTLSSAATEIYGVLEGLVDGVTLLLGGAADLLTAGQFHKEISEGTKWAISQDITGVGFLRDEINDITRKYTYIDKSTGWKIFNDVLVGIAQMAPLALNTIAPGVGTFVYYGGMAGRTAEETIITNPDIDLSALIGYTASSVGVEALVETISSKIFNTPTAVDSLFGGTNAVVRKGGFVRHLFADMLSEGAEEMVSEFANSVLNIAFIDPNAPLASVQDVLYAGLIGGLIGALVTGGSVATTRNAFVTKDGQLTTYKDAKKADLEGVKLTKMQTLELKTALSEATQTMRQSAVTDLYAKYSTEDISTIQTKHADEYQKAVEKDVKKQKIILDTTMALSKVLEKAGAEGFAKAAELAQYTIDQQSKFIRRFTEYTPATDAKLAIVEAKINQANPNSTATITEDLNATQLKIRDAFKKMGIDLYYATYGESDGQARQHEIVLDEKTVVMDADLFKNASYDYIVEKVAKRSLVKTLQTQSGVLSKNALIRLKMLLFSNTNYDVGKLDDVAYLNDTQIDSLSDEELKQYANKQAEVLSQTLLFDELTIRKVFLGDKSTFKGVYKWFNKTKNFLEKFAKKDDLNKVKYRSLLQSMRLYEDVVAETSLNEQYAQDAAKDLDVSPTIMKRIGEKFDPSKHSKTFEHWSYVPLDISRNALEYVNCVEGLHNATNGKFNYQNAFDVNTYTKDFVTMIEQRTKKNETFQHALQTYLIQTYGKVIDTKHERLVAVTKFRNHVSEKFANLLDQLVNKKITFEDFTAQISTVSDVFNTEFNEKIFDEFTGETLKDIPLVFQKVDRATNKDDRGMFDIETNTITIYVDPTITKKSNLNFEFAEMEHSIYHEVQHIIATWFNMYNGGNPNSLAISLSTKNNRKTAENIWNRFHNNTFDDLVRKKGESEAFKDVGEFVYINMAGEKLAESTGKKGDTAAIYGTTDYFDVMDTDDGYLVKGYGKFSPFLFYVDYSVWFDAFQRKTIQEEKLIEQENTNVKTWFAENNIPLTGFSEDFVDAFNSDTLSTNTLWEMINLNTIGDENATNIIINYLAPNNKHIKTISDVEIAKSKGIPSAKVYFTLRLQKDTQFAKNKIFSIDKITNFIDEHPNAPITYSDKAGQHKTSLTTYLLKQYSKLTQPLTADNANQVIIQSDFAYTANGIDKVIKMLTNQQYTESKKAVQDNVGGEDSKSSQISDLEQFEEFKAKSDVNKKDDVAETIEKRAHRAYTTTIKQIKDWLTTVGKAGETYVIKDYLDLATKGREQLTDKQLKDFGISDLFETSKLIEIVDNVITDDNQFEVMDKLRNNRDVIDTFYGEGTYDIVKKHLSEQGRIEKSTYSKRAKRLLDKLKNMENLPDVYSKLLTVDTKEFTVLDYEDYVERLKTATVLLNSDGTPKLFFKGAYKSDISRFDSGKGDKRKISPASWYSDNIEVAKTYANPNRPNATVYADYLWIEKARIFDAENKEWNISTQGKTTDQLAQEVYNSNIGKPQKYQYDAVIIENIIDIGGLGSDEALKPSTDIGVFIPAKQERQYQAPTAEIDAKLKGDAQQPIEESSVKLTKERKIEKTVVEEMKIATPSENINIVNGNTIADAILNAFDGLTQGISESQFFDVAGKDYTKVGMKMIDEHASLFVTITNDNYEDVRNSLKASTKFYADQALLIFDLFTLEMKGKFSTDIQNKIENYNRRELTKSAQKLALQAKRVANRKPITNTLRQFAHEGWTAKITDEQLQELDAKLKDKDAYIADLSKKIAELEKQIKTTANELERQALLREVKEVSDQKLTIQHGTNEDIADWLVTHADTVESAMRMQENLLNKALRAAERAESENKELGYFFYNKDGTPKPFPKTRERIFKTLKGLRSFRMWAMLSSPVTWVRNWFGNQGMKALDGATNAIERAISKHIKFDTTQMKFNETRAGKRVYDHIVETNAVFVNSLVRGGSAKYDTTGSKAADIKRQTRAKEYESANTFKKLCLKAQEWTDKGLSTGVLGDEPMLFNSIVKNMGNLVASNPEFLLQGIRNELSALQNKKTLSESQQTRKTILEKAIETNDVNDIFDALSKEETERLFGQAQQMAFQQYFRNSNVFSRWVGNLGSKNPVAAEIVSWIMPFPKVAVNVLSMAYRYSPLGFISGLMQWSQARQVTAEGYKGPSTGFEQAKAIRSFSEASVGTVMLIAGAIAAALGWVDIDDDDYLGPCLNFGDIRISLSELAPSMTTFSTAAAMIWAWKNNKSAVSEALNVLYDNTLLGNIDNLFRYSSLETFGQNLSISYLSQYIPAFVKWVNKAILQTPTKDKSGPYLTKLAKTLGSYIPGIATLVPDKVDPYTGKKVYASGSDNWFLNFIAGTSPLGIKYDTSSGFAAEAERLGAETTGLEGSFKINSKQYTVSGKQKETLAKYRANYLQAEYVKIMNGQQLVTIEDKNGKRITTKYNKLTDEQKANVLKNLYSKATDITKIKYWIDTGNAYYTSNKDEYNRLRKTITSGIYYKAGWSKSKFVER